MSATTRRMWIRPPATWKTNPPRTQATNRMTNAIRNRDRNTAVSFSASPPTKSPGGSASGMARSPLPESLGEPEAALGTAEPLHSHAQVLATGLALGGRHPRTVRIGAPSAYWTLVQYPRPAVGPAGEEGRTSGEFPLGWWLTYTCRPGSAPPK